MTAGPPPRRRGGVLRWLLAGLILLPLVEIVILVAVGRWIGVLWTVAVLVGMAVLGAWISRREAGRALRSLRRTVESGRMPTDEATDAMLVILGGLLLILPGFATDAVGLLMVLPLTRPGARRLLQLLAARQAARLAAAHPGPPRRRRSSAPGGGDVIEGEILADEPPPGGRPGEGPTPLGR